MPESKLQRATVSSERKRCAEIARREMEKWEEREKEALGLGVKNPVPMLYAAHAAARIYKMIKSGY